MNHFLIFLAIYIYEEEDKELLEKVASRDVTEGLIKQKLSQHVDQVPLFLSTFLSF
mgnify:CR=1 FL=1